MLFWLGVALFALVVLAHSLQEGMRRVACRKHGHGPFREVEGGQQCRVCGNIDPW